MSSLGGGASGKLVNFTLKLPRSLHGLKWGVTVNEDGVVIAIVKGSIASHRDDDGEGLLHGDEILEINSTIMDGQCMNPMLQPLANSKGSQVSRRASSKRSSPTPISPHLPTSPHTSLHLSPLSPHISPNLPTSLHISPHISPHTSPHISPNLTQISPHLAGVDLS